MHLMKILILHSLLAIVFFLNCTRKGKGAFYTSECSIFWLIGCLLMCVCHLSFSVEQKNLWSIRPAVSPLIHQTGVSHNVHTCILTFSAVDIKIYSFFYPCLKEQKLFFFLYFCLQHCVQLLLLTKLLQMLFLFTVLLQLFIIFFIAFSSRRNSMAFSSPPSTYNTSAPASESRSDTLINPDPYSQGDPPPIPPRGNPPPVVEVWDSVK